MSYDIISAIESEADIITMPNSLINKLDKIGKEPSEYSLETDQMFYDDAVKSNYIIYYYGILYNICWRNKSKIRRGLQNRGDFDLLRQQIETETRR